MTPNAYCQEKAAASGSSFYYSFLFLPPERRAAIMALYAFCREVDDIVDERETDGQAAADLDWWREEINRVENGTPRHPIGLALQETQQRFHLPAARLLEIIDGMAMDLGLVRYPDFERLSLYCYRVASVVGMLAAEIFGVQDQGTLDYARDLGMAFQITNILRDVGEDARLGRVYLPIREMERFQVPFADLFTGRDSEPFKALMRFQAERARQYYDSALRKLPAIDRKTQRPGLVMAAIYRALLDEIEAADFQVLSRRVSLSSPRKLWLAWKTWNFGLRLNPPKTPRP